MPELQWPRQRLWLLFALCDTTLATSILPTSLVRERFFLHVERRTGFIGKLIVTVYCRTGEFSAEFRNELDECGSLRLGACVFGRFAVLGTTAYIADAYGVSIVAGSVGANLLDWPTRMNGAVSVDDEVVADVFPAVALGLRCGVPLSDLLYCVVFALRSGSAMDNDFVDDTHSLYGFRFLLL